MRTLGRVLVGLTAVVVFTGTVVTSTGPHGGDEEAKRFEFDLQRRRPDSRHQRDPVPRVGAGHAVAPAPHTRTRSGHGRLGAVLLVACIQAAIGYIQYFNDIPALLVGFHIAGATALWAAVHLVLPRALRQHRRGRGTDPRRRRGQDGRRLAGLGGVGVRSRRARPPGRRNVRALPALLRASGAHRSRRHRRRRGPRRRHVGPRPARRRRDPRRRRYRSHHRVVPQRPLGRSTRPVPGHRPRAVHAVPTARGRAAARSASRCGPRSSSKPTTRSRRPRSRLRSTTARRGDRDLHARQGPRAVRARSAGRPARPAGGQALRRGRRPREVRRAPGLDSRLARARWATAPTGSPVFPAGARSRRPRCSRATRPSKRFPSRPVGRRRAGRGQARGDPRSRARARPACSRCSRPCAPTATVGTVDDWHWRGPTPEFAAWCDRVGSARLGQHAEALAEGAGELARVERLGDLEADRFAPLVAVRHLVRGTRAARRPSAGGVAERHARTEDPAFVLRERRGSRAPGRARTPWRTSTPSRRPRPAPRASPTTSRDGSTRPSGRDCAKLASSSGYSSKWSASHCADRCTRSVCAFSGSSGSALAMMRRSL